MKDSMQKARILVIDDDEVTRQLLNEVLSRSSYEVELAASGEEALKKISGGRAEYPVILSDIRMLEVSGMAVLREVKKYLPESVMILMTGFGSMEGALEAIREGAFDYISKPFKLDELKAIVARAQKHWELQRSHSKNSELHSERSVLRSQTMIGKSQKIVEVYKTVARAALSTSNVLLLGEGGTGKQLVAHAIHDNSPRRNQPFVSLSGSEMDHFQEHFETAKGGTIFVDRLIELDASCQLKLFRAIQGAEARQSEIRIMGASRQPLDEAVKSGKFRDDLFYKLSAISIELPSLRDRIEDLPELVEYFLVRHAERDKKQISHLSEEAMERLKNYLWPGNVRELEHVIERAVALTNTPVLYPEDFPELIASPSFSQRGNSLEKMEHAHILTVLEEVSYNKSKASEVLGIDRATLYRKAQRYGIDLRGK
jgi:two-component system, NtrC family, response regulator AtoC